MTLDHMKVTQESWPNSPMPARRQRMAFERHYRADEYTRLSQGHLPEDMDDRWFMWAGNDHVVHFHRSWSGFEIYELRLRPSDDGYDVAEIWVNDDPDQYQPDPDLDEALIGSMLDSFANR
jgi:hypothetical protein